MSRFANALIIAAFASTAVPALAQNEQHGMSGMSSMPGMNMSNMGPMMGSHMMKASVTTVDGKTGIVDVTAGGMALKLHFPPASLANVKVGDTITVHLAFSKP